MSVLAGPARARWFNPASASFTQIAAALANDAAHAFTPPGDNGSGFSDWALVLEVQ